MSCHKFIILFMILVMMISSFCIFNIIGVVIYMIILIAYLNKEIERLDKWIVGICCDIILWGALFMAMGVATVNEYYDVDLDLDQIKIDFGSKKLMLILTAVIFIFTLIKCCIFVVFCRYVHTYPINEDEENRNILVSVKVG